MLLLSLLLSLVKRQSYQKVALSLCLLLTETIHFDLLCALIFFSQCEKLPQGGGGEVGGIEGGVRGGGGGGGTEVEAEATFSFMTAS